MATVGLTNPFPTAAAATETIYGYAPSALQTGITVEDNSISGTLKYVTTGDLASYWGPGNFLALKFALGESDATNARVGLFPSMGSGMAALDSDMDGAAVITDPKTQRFAVCETVDGKNHWSFYDLSELVCETEA